MEDHGEQEEVFCAVVPDVEKFTLADNLLTMNCPYCRDSRHRLRVNHLYGQPDNRGWPRRHLAHCFNEDCLADRQTRDDFFQLLFRFRNARERLLSPPFPGRRDWTDDGFSATQKLIARPCIGATAGMHKLKRTGPLSSISATACCAATCISTRRTRTAA